MRNATNLRWLSGALAVVGLSLSAEYARAQDEAPLAASPAPPPDVQEREKMGKPPAPPGRSPEVDELLQKVKLTRADIERKKADKSEPALPGGSDEAPDVKEIKKAEKAPPPPGRSPDLAELIDKIRKQPGGKEKLEKAEKAGAKIPKGAGGATLESILERMPGPRMDGPVFGSDSRAEQLPTLKATRPIPYQNVAGLGYLSVGDWSPNNSNSTPMWGPYYRYLNPNHFLVGNVDVKPYAYASVNVTNPGWYILNFVATKGKASLKRYVAGSTPPFATVTQWDNSASTTQYESYPFVVNLAAGYHTFYWIPEAGYYFWLSEVTLMKL
ncbi:MAG: hypothetical protein ACXWWN_07930 [Gemmatimonadales bacterium]